jgi:D-3-phosphoglycerate dehydrogenase
MNTLDKVAITSRSFSANKYLVEELRARYANITLNNSGKTLVGSELLEFLDGQNKVIVGLENFDKNLIDQLPELKVISKFGVGLNNIDLESMKEHSISLGFQPGTNKQSVAELALMHIFIALRKAPSSKEDICNNIWSQNKGHELFGKTIGIIGFGNIGQRLAELLEPFKCKIIFYDGIEFSKEELVDKFPSRSEDFINNLQQSSLNEVLKEADIVSIHIPLLEETQNLISVDELACLKKDVRIINTSRGGIVDEKALEDFLNQNKNAFATFDVFETEPAFNHPLLKLNNFYATSHLGSMTIEGVISMGIAAINGLDENRIPL